MTNPFGLADVGRDSTPSLGDLDGDGDLDLVAGEGAGGFFYFENTGSATSPAFAAAVTNPFGLAGVGYDSTPALGDVDRDGDLDLVAGEYGDFFYFENTGSATSPAFAAALTNPFDLAPVGTDLALSLGDVDGDGDLDLVAGEYDGVFRPYLLPEPDQGLMLGAGISFLKLLERLRRRGERRSPPPPPG